MKRQIKHLINQKFEELNRRDRWFGWTVNIIGIILTCVSLFFIIKFRQHWNLDEVLGQLRADIQVLYHWCQRLEEQLSDFRNFQTFTSILLFVYGVALIVMAIYILLRP